MPGRGACCRLVLPLLWWNVVDLLVVGIQHVLGTALGAASWELQLRVLAMEGCNDGLFPLLMTSCSCGC
jgi:hypothetical protein